MSCCLLCGSESDLFTPFGIAQSDEKDNDPIIFCNNNDDETTILIMKHTL